MNTFLPYPSFRESAACLDRARLGKQRVEALQLLDALSFGGRWARHPAARMWRGCEAALAEYALAVCSEWRRRGYDDGVAGQVHWICDARGLVPFGEGGLLQWFGDPAFHASHRSNLLRKDPAWYGRLGWAEPPDLPYVWPA